MLERLRQLQPEQMACYPEREPVEREVASFLGLPPEQVLLTNGVDEAIHLVCETYLEPDDDALIVVPTFAMYQICAAATGAQVVSIPTEADFRFPTSKILAYTTAPKTRLIAIANPNNPTGAVASVEDLLLIARSAPQAAVLVDEAYFEFHGESLLEYVGQVQNLFVARTFSKAYGMASLRVGVLAGAAEQIQSLRRACSPYNVNGVALACLPAALDRSGIRSPVCCRSAVRAGIGWKKNSASSEFPSGRARQILCWRGSGPATRILSGGCGRAEFWCATGLRISVAMGAFALPQAGGNTPNGC